MGVRRTRREAVCVHQGTTLPAAPAVRWAVPPVGYAAVAVALGYYLGAKLGFALTPDSQPISTLWPPNAILLGALLIAPRRTWAALLLAALVAHLAVELGSGVPLPMVLSWFISNTSEALIGAVALQRLSSGPLR